jgi:hypothetical protein
MPDFNVTHKIWLDLSVKISPLPSQLKGGGALMMQMTEPNIGLG